MLPPDLNGVWVFDDGRMAPCCLVHTVADMGSIHDGPLMQNARYLRVKALLATGKVFPACLKTRGCQYVQQRLAAGRRLELITPEEPGELQPEAAEVSAEPQLVAS